MPAREPSRPVPDRPAGRCSREAPGRPPDTDCRSNVDAAHNDPRPGNGPRKASFRQMAQHRTPRFSDICVPRTATGHWHFPDRWKHPGINSPDRFGKTRTRNRIQPTPDRGSAWIRQTTPQMLHGSNVCRRDKTQAEAPSDQTVQPQPGGQAVADRVRPTNPP